MPDATPPGPARRGRALRTPTTSRARPVGRDDDHLARAAEDLAAAGPDAVENNLDAIAGAGPEGARIAAAVRRLHRRARIAAGLARLARLARRLNRGGSR